MVFLILCACDRFSYFVSPDDCVIVDSGLHSDILWRLCSPYPQWLLMTIHTYLRCIMYTLMQIPMFIMMACRFSNDVFVVVADDDRM